MAVIVTQAVDISQPLAKQVVEDSDEEEEEKFESVYNKATDEPTQRGDKGPSQSRLTKFTVYDGMNKFQALEYEMLGMVADFNSAGILLCLSPPIMVRKGLLLLKR